MLTAAFRVAMFNRLTTGPYHQPWVESGEGNEWLIVEKSGPDGSVLQIAEAGPAPGLPPEQAPTELLPKLSILGLLVHASEDRQVFLFLREQPAGIRADGIFFPADGIAELTQTNGSLMLRAWGRHFHRQIVQNGVPALADVPFPLSDTQGGSGINWHFTATRLPWAGEV